jgi:hypothetical protein
LAAGKLSKLHQTSLGIKEFIRSGFVMDEYCDKAISLLILFIARNGRPNPIQLFLEASLYR